MVFTALFAFSPIWISSVAWLAARKHLLSTLFIFISTSELTKLEKHDLKKKSTLKIAGFYFLSLISQPINILWPIWASYYLHVKNKLKEAKLLLTSIMTLMLVFSIANYYYFSVFYLKIGYAKYLNFDFLEKVSRMFLALGRYFQLVVFPFSALPSPHSDHSPLNIIGMILFVCLVIFLYFKAKKNPHQKHQLLLPLSYFVIHLILISYNNNIFASDTYLLNASLGIYLLVFHLKNMYTMLPHYHLTN
jgi:tryptophan-rich sensory protein